VEDDGKGGHDVKTDHKECRMLECGLHSSDRLGLFVGSAELRNELSGFITAGKVLTS
jgi:hypothetical protein